VRYTSHTGLQYPRSPEHKSTFTIVVTPIVMAHPYTSALTAKSSMQSRTPNFGGALLRDDCKTILVRRTYVAHTSARS
jgi:hypothetical protein